MKLKLNKTSVEKDCIPPVPGELNSKGKPVFQKLYMDCELKGFGLLVGRSFAVSIFRNKFSLLVEIHFHDSVYTDAMTAMEIPLILPNEALSVLFIQPCNFRSL